MSSTAVVSVQKDTAAPSIFVTSETQDTDKKVRGVRLDFYTSLLTVDYLHPLEERSSVIRSSTDELYVGVGPMSDMRFGLGLGGAVNEQITLGARVILGLAVSQDDIDDSASIDLSYGFLPYFNYAFGNKPVRPFIEAALGVVGKSGEFIGDGVSFAVAAGPGLRILCGPRAAVDFWLNETLTVGTALYTDNAYMNSEYREGKYIGSHTGLMLGLDVLL